MKPIIVIALFLLSLSCSYSQTDWSAFDEILAKKSSEISELSAAITQPYDGEYEKLQAIYYWVTHNIKYDIHKFEEHQDKRVKKQTFTSEKEYKDFLDNEIKMTLKRKKGVCQDYAMVFESLCQYAGLEAELVGGWAKYSPVVSSSKGRSHAWNVVKVNGDWRFVDPTFGSGYVDEKQKFKFRFDPNHFLVDNNTFILNHFPREEKWQLLENAVDEEQYKSFPYVGSGFMEFGLNNLSPLTGKVEIKKGEDLEIRFNAKKKIFNLVCYNMSNGKPVSLTISEDAMSYLVKRDAKDVRGGSYIYMVGEKILFTHKVSVVN